MELKDILKTMRESRNLQRGDVARQLGITAAAVSNYELGYRKPRYATLEAYADFFNVPLSSLLGERSTLPNRVKPIKDVVRHKVPVLGEVACGEPVPANDEVQEYVSAPEKADYALRIQGDSMAPTFMNGDIAYIRKQPYADDGQMAVVLLDDSAVLKRIYHVKDGLTLVSENPKYPPKTVTFKDYEYIAILGIPVGFTRMF